MKYFLLSLIAVSLASCGELRQQSNKKADLHTQNELNNNALHWEYDGEHDPEHWAELSPEFIQCAEGHFQSPIDLESYSIKSIKHDLLQFNYHPCSVDLVNNGHTIQANIEASDEALIANGEAYALQQVHFHSPAEHQIDGIIYPMEMHMVHVNEEGKLAVVGVFIKEGHENTTLAGLWEKLPEQVAEHVHPEKNCDVLHLLPDVHTVFHYSGSLTTPPCSEGVEWFVMKNPIELSKAQIKAFRKQYHHNNRPVQLQDMLSVEEID